MKKIVILTVCLAAFVANSFGQNVIKKGEQGVSSVGVILGHAITSKAFTIGADYRYNIDDRIRFAPSALYTLKNDGISSMYLNADAHYLARITDKATIYPIGGVGLSHWRWDSFIIDDLEPLGGHGYSRTIVKETKIRIGVNLGFGGEMRITDDIIAGAEFRYNLTSERFYDQAMLLARVAYYF